MLQKLIDFILKERTDAAEWKDDAGKIMEMAGAANQELKVMKQALEEAARMAVSK